MKLKIKTSYFSKSLFVFSAIWGFVCAGVASATPSLTGTAGLQQMVTDTTQSMGYLSVAVVAFCVVAGPTLMATGLMHLHKHFSQQQSGQSSIAKPITEIAVGSALLFSIYLAYTLGSSFTGGTSSQSDVQYIQNSGIGSAAGAFRDI